MHHYQLTLFTGVLALLMSCTGRLEVEEAIAPERLKLPELSQEPLPPAVALTADYFRKSYPHLSPEQFEQKWIHSQKSGLLFMRSFVNTWYDELARVSSTGPIGPCFGDPHPENFGYLVFAVHFEYTYNDVDDSGLCPVAFDALRYFTTLKLVLNDRVLEAELLRAYTGFLNGDRPLQKISDQLRPDASLALRQMMKRTTLKGKLRQEAAHVPLSPSQTQALFANLQAASRACEGCKLLDATEVRNTMGGSAGLARYWLLLESHEQGQHILEFKELTEPASQRGPWVLEERPSRSVILNAIWGRSWPSSYALTIHDGKTFLVRSRLAADQDLDVLNPAEKKAILTEQVYLLAQLHKKTWGGSTLLEEWLGRQSEFQSRRYSEALLAARGR